MKSLFFDAGPVINFTLNDLLWVLGSLNKRYKGRFYITPGVKTELIDKPLKTKRFELEALQIIRAIRKKYITVKEDPTLKKRTEELLNIANSIFSCHHHPIKILQYGEIETLVAGMKYKADALVIDERTLRTLIEKPNTLVHLLRRKMRSKVFVDKDNMKAFSNAVGDLRVIRSVELVTVAYELGILDMFLPTEIPNGKQRLLDSLLWAMKLHGCSINVKEINQILALHKS